jgi:pentatricopeptide repeat protein
MKARSLSAKAPRCCSRTTNIRANRTATVDHRHFPASVVSIFTTLSFQCYERNLQSLERNGMKVFFSTSSSPMESSSPSTQGATRHFDESDACLDKLRKVAKTGSAYDAEKVLRQIDDNWLDKISSSDLTTCYNLALEAWTRSKDVNSADRAQRLLRSMTEPNILSYLHVLNCWSSAKKNKRAGEQGEILLRKLHELGLEDLSSAYHFVLKACARAGDGERATRILREMLKSRQDMIINKHVVNTVLMAMKSTPSHAEALLDKCDKQFGINPDAIHYATVLGAWAEKRNGPRTEALIKKMLSNGVKANIAAYNSLLYSWRDDLDRMEGIFHGMIQDYAKCSYRDLMNKDRHNKEPYPPAVKPNLESLNLVLTAQARATAPERAEALLDWVVNDPEIRNVIQPNIVCLSSVLNAWARAKQPERVEALLHKIQQAGFEPNVVTYTIALQAWAAQGNVELAEAIWNQMVCEHNIQPSAYTLNNLILAYANSGRAHEAQEVLRSRSIEHGISPDVVSYTTLLKALSKYPQEARQLLDHIRVREEKENVYLLDLVAYNTILHHYSKEGWAQEAENLLYQMQQHSNKKVRPNSQSYAHVMSAYSKSPYKNTSGIKAEELSAQMEANGIRPTLISQNTLLHCHAVSGSADRAEALLKRMIQSDNLEVDVVSWNTCLHAWSKAGDPFRAEQLLMEMVSEVEAHGKKGNAKKSRVVNPDVRSFSIVLQAWAKQRTVEASKHAEAILKHMHAMGNRCSPDTIAYNTVITAWMKAAVASGRQKDVVAECASRADSLLLDMEKQQAASKQNKVRPDKLSYDSVIQLWKWAGHSERADELQEKIPLVARS